MKVTDEMLLALLLLKEECAKIAEKEGRKAPKVIRDIDVERLVGG